VSKTTVQKILVDHELGRRSQRVARAAALVALTTGLVTETAAEEEPFGFCHYSPDPGGLVALDSFYIGNLKGVGKVYQLTAVDTATTRRRNHSDYMRGRTPAEVLKMHAKRTAACPGSEGLVITATVGLFDL
jgi:hypothetical protein